MKAIIINGSPRKKFNTAQMLESAMKGAQEAGAECDWINLFDYEFTGCRSCFACKIKNSKTNGLCAVKDSIRPILEKAKDADVLIFGSPVYYGYPTGQLRSFVERLLFPLDTYMVDKNGQRVKFEHKPIQTGLIYTMNCPEWLMEKVEYPTLLGFTGTEIGRLCGYNEVLYSCDTYQFSDYSRYHYNHKGGATRFLPPRSGSPGSDLQRYKTGRRHGLFALMPAKDTPAQPQPL